MRKIVFYKCRKGYKQNCILLLKLQKLQIKGIEYDSH